jgi:hypothetical protein
MNGSDAEIIRVTFHTSTRAPPRPRDRDAQAPSDRTWTRQRYPHLFHRSWLCSAGKHMHVDALLTYLFFNVSSRKAGPGPEWTIS